MEWAHQNEIEVTVDLQGDHELPLDTGQTLYRILQEALANASRHSAASLVHLSLLYEPDSVTMIIEDDGIGFDVTQQHDGMGLASMQERSEAANGSLDLDSEPGKGTRVCVTLPLRDSDQR